MDDSIKESLGIKLANLALAVLIISFTVAAAICFLQKSYFSGLLLLMVAGFLLLSFRWSDYGRISLLLFLIFFYLAAYLTNVFLILTSTKGIDILQEQRLQAAQSSGRPFDSRTPLQVVADLKGRGIEAVPVLYPFDLLSRNGLPENGRRILTLASISRRTTVFCNECGKFSIYQADEHGFNNPGGLWPPEPVDILLLGDSFCHGACVPPGGDVGGLLRAAGQRVLNLGFSGNGPLLELATLKEYGAAIKPKIVLWLYFEGNDLTDLDHEKVCPPLRQYFQDETYTQDLIHRQGEIDRALEKYLGALEIRKDQERNKPWYRHKKFLVALRSFQLKNLKSAIRHLQTILPEYLYHENVHLFKEVMAMAQKTVHSWGGTLYFVYLPSYHRYAGQAQVSPLNRRDLVINAVHSLGIPLIDFHPVLNSLPDPLVMFPFRKDGHYNEEGYRLLSQEILGALNGSSSSGQKQD